MPLLLMCCLVDGLRPFWSSAGQVESTPPDTWVRYASHFHTKCFANFYLFIYFYIAVVGISFFILLGS